MKPRVCIIGGGLAGISVADQLSATGIDYILIEKENQLDHFPAIDTFKNPYLRKLLSEANRPMLNRNNLMLGTEVIAINDWEHQLTLADESIISYTHLVNTASANAFGVMPSEENDVYFLESTPLDVESTLETGMKLADVLYDKIKKRPLTLEEKQNKEEYLSSNSALREEIEEALGVKFCEIAHDLEQHGIVRLDNLFSPEQIKMMQHEFSGWSEKKNYDEKLLQQHFDAVSNESYLTLSVACSMAVTHPLLWLLATHYWGKDIQLAAYRSVSILPTDNEQARINSYRWHNDAEGKTVKAMILITDVEDDGQRMRFYPNTHTQDPLLRRNVDARYSDDEVSQMNRSYINCSGPAGTVYIFNPEAIHSGTRNASQRRDVLLFTFRPFPNLLPVPEINESVVQNFSAYEKKIFRVGVARAQAQNLFEDLRKEQRSEGILARKLQLITMNASYETMRRRYPEACRPLENYSLNRFFIRDRQFYNHDFDNSETNLDVATAVFLALDTKKPLLAKWLKKDLTCHFDFPLSPPPAARNRLRDPAFRAIREELTEEELALNNLIDLMIENWNEKKNSQGYCNNESLTDLARNLLLILNNIKQSDIYAYEISCYSILVEDISDCFSWATDYQSRRSGLALILGTILHIQSLIHSDCFVTENMTINDQLAQLFNDAASVYITNLCLDPIAFNTRTLTSTLGSIGYRGKNR